MSSAPRNELWLTAVMSSILFLAIAVVPRFALAGCSCGSWPGRTNLNICIRSGATCLPSTWDTPTQNSLAEWNRFTDIWRVLTNRTDSITFNDQLNSIAWLTRATTNQRYGSNLGTSVLAVTFTTAQPGLGGNATCPLPAGQRCVTLQEADIVMLLDQTFNTDPVQVYNARRNGTNVFDFRQVMIHEAGHAMGLKHETRSAAIMHPNYRDYLGMTLTADDVNISRLSYPGLSTTFSDMALIGYGFSSGTYTRMNVRNRGTRAGLDSIEISGFTVENRSASAASTTLTIRIGGVTAGTLNCNNIGAYRSCSASSSFSFNIPQSVTARSAAVEVRINDPHSGSLSGNNRLTIGTAQVTPRSAQDRDNDGFTPAGGDCDDDDRTINPSAVEICDGRDQDCSGVADDGPSGQPLEESCYSGPNGTAGVGLCSAGIRRCLGGQWSSCNGQTLPMAEMCDGRDEDCNGTADDDLSGAPLTQSCYSGPPGTSGVGICVDGISTCRSGNFSACEGEVIPGDESCDGIDEDCDGLFDEDAAGNALTQSCYSGPEGTEGVGQCAAGVSTCEQGAFAACVGEVLPGKEECNGIDDDCDGAVDVDEDGRALIETCYEGPPATADVGVCQSGIRTCAGGQFGACAGQVLPSAELCNGVDDDCDGRIDVAPDGTSVCPVDAGVGPDAANATLDGSTMGPRDGGIITVDTGIAGPGGDDDDPGGCGCATSAPTPIPPLDATLIGLALIAFYWRRRIA